MSIRAAVMTAPGAPMEVWDLPDPELSSGEVLLETVASEVCGTDVHLHHGRLAGVPYPIIPGHVSVGRVVEVARRDRAGVVAVGDLVTFLDVHQVCHACHHCLVLGQPNRCPSRKVYGISHSAHEGLLGGWAEAIVLRPDVQILKIPEELTAQDVIGGGCGLFTGFAAVERSTLAMGDTVVVQGAGPVGLASLAFAGLRGAGRLILIGAPEARLELGKLFGADEVLHLEHTSPAERREMVLTATQGRGADVVLEASGNPVAIPEGLNLLRDGGTYVVAGHYTDAGPTEVNPHSQVNRKHARILGQWGTDLRHLVGALRLLARHRDRLPFKRVIGAAYGLDETGQALADVEALSVTKAIIQPGIRR
ncbi:MAG: zinc-binding dehydrogenase [Gemmatimonadota bacterium]